jgi:hypothetical protein
MTATETGPLTAAELDLIDAWWRAANYLSIWQIYLLDNPLLHSAEIRSRAAAGLAFLGVAVDESRNTLDKKARGDDWEITAPDARVRTFVIAAREDKQIAAEVRAVLPSL